MRVRAPEYMIRAMQRWNDTDFGDPGQTLGYRGGTYRNLVREFFCLSPVDTNTAVEEPSEARPPLPAAAATAHKFFMGPDGVLRLGSPDAAPARVCMAPHPCATFARTAEAAGASTPQ